jgi:hypothetical protein
MQRSKVRLVIAAALFCAWISWLVYLAATTTRPTVLSRPQLLVADLVVIADVKEGPNGPLPQVAVREILPRDRKLPPTITVTNLPMFQGKLGRGGTEEFKGWEGPGTYILPLKDNHDHDHTYDVVDIPPSPGFPPHRRPAPRTRIYPATPATEEQLKAIWKEYGR